MEFEGTHDLETHEGGPGSQGTVSIRIGEDHLTGFRAIQEAWGTRVQPVGGHLVPELPGMDL